MSSIRTFLRNIVANWFGQLAGIVVLLFLSPFVVHTLGKTEYGLWGLLTLVTGYLGVFDLGVRASTGRYITLYLGAGDHERVDQTLRTGLTFYSLIALGLLAVAGVLGWLFPLLFKSTPEGYHTTVQILLPLMAANVWLSAVSGVSASLLAAHDRFVLLRVVDLSTLALKTVATVLALLAGYRIVALAVISVAGAMLIATANYLIARRVYPRARMLPPALNRERLKELFGFGIPAFISSVASQIIGQADLLLVGILFGLQAVAVYSIGCMLILYAWPFIQQIEGTLYPGIQRSVGAQDWGAVRYSGIRMMKFVLIVGLAIYLGLIFFGDSFIRLWMGPGFAESATVMVLLAASRIIHLVPECEAMLLYARGHIWFLTTMVMVDAGLTVGFAMALGLGAGLGLAGIASGAMISRGLLFTIYVVYGHRKTGLRPAAVLRHAIAPGAGVAIAFAGWCLLVRWCLPGQTWAWFAFQVIVALIGYAVVAGAFLVPQADRARVWKFLGVARAASGPQG